MPPAMASADDLDDEKARASRRSSGNFKPRVSVVGGQKGSGTQRKAAKAKDPPKATFDQSLISCINYCEIKWSSPKAHDTGGSGVG